MALISVDGVSKRFPLPDRKGEFTVLDDVSLAVRPGEVVALLGRSGSGKSTLLRIMAGLIQPSAGQVLSHGQPLRGTNRHLAMVFQSFALLPWLTVQDNVELGLAARHFPRKERRERALKAIDIVGLDGFENAYPKELSGGMKQRVGFARAFVLDPEVLFMDEPFSALDVLTAENLRGEIDDLWNAGTFPSKSILIVTHNIEEAIYLADRVVILGANPGLLRGELTIDLPRPHDRRHPRFKALVDYVYAVMTNPDIAMTGPLATDQLEPGVAPAVLSPFARPLPHVRVGGISGLLELMNEQGDGLRDIPLLAERLQLEVDDLLPLLDAAVLLGFAEVADGDVRLTPVGQDFATTTILRSKDLFRQQALNRVPVLNSIVHTLRQKANGSLRSEFFLDIWDDHFPNEEAERQMATAIDWGRYGELFEYDASEGRLSLPR
ncbi:MAG: nitrate/sulfonate/bicarbonate ABC transporter ATP-binding protein [Cyanobacteriota bacterium]